MKYRKKPVVIEAFKYDGDFKGKDGYYVPIWAVEALKKGKLYYDSIHAESPPCELFIKRDTIYIFPRIVDVGDFIIKNSEGKLHVIKTDIFEEIYEKVED